MKYILNNDNLEVIGKQYLQGVGDYDGTNIGSATDLATVINNNKYVLPKATTDTLGGIKIGAGLIHDSQDGEGFVKVNIDNKTLNVERFNTAIQLGKDVEWVNIGSVTNINDFVTDGIYNILGEHTRNDDNLPINNIGSGHTFSGRLLVYDSSLPNTGNDSKDCCITQVLTLSNRVGGDSNIYIRTASGSTRDNLTWSKWGKLQANVEVGVIDSSELDTLVDNGMYSGVTTFNNAHLTFVLITVNNYAVAGQIGVNSNCTQLIYGVDTNGNIITKKRSATKENNTWTFNAWQELSNEIPKATTDTLGGINAVQSFIGTAAIVDDNNNIYLDNGIVKSNTGKLYGINTALEYLYNKAFVHIPYASDTTPGIVSIGSGLKHGYINGGIAVKLDHKTLFFDNDTVNIQLGREVEWVNTGSVTNMNDFVTDGIYNISGEHTRNDDNLPINNTGGGHTFNGRLSVFDSSLPNTGNDSKDCCLTQLLTLSNRVGGDGNMYIRTASGSTKSNLNWGDWGKLQTNVEVGVIDSSELDTLVDNGMYSGVTTFNNAHLTFVLITVNNYAIAGANGVSPSCTQLIYGVDINGTVTIKKRIGTKNTSTNTWSFDEWDSISSTDIINCYSTSYTNYTIEPNKFYIWDEVPSLTINLGQGISNKVNEYMFQFTSGSTPTTLSLPSNIKWVNDELPIIESNYIYQISILNGLGSIMKFKK